MRHWRHLLFAAGLLWATPALAQQLLTGMTGAQCAAEYAINTRAMENTIYYMAINRVGVERGCTFIGQSRICDPLGRTLALGSFDKEEILYATIDPTIARQKHLIRVPGKNEVNRIADRRPEMYGPIQWLHTLPRPGRGAPVVAES